MGSQPSSFSSHRELKGFLVTKQLSARRKINLSKKFSESDILTLIEYNEKELCRKENEKIIRPQSEKVISLSEIADHSETEISTSKKINPDFVFSLKTKQTLSNSVESGIKHHSPPSNVENKTKALQIYSPSLTLPNSINEIYVYPPQLHSDTQTITKSVTNKKHNTGENMDVKLKGKDSGSFKHLDHGVHKNEPYVQSSDIQPSTQEESTSQGKTTDKKIVPAPKSNKSVKEEDDEEIDDHNDDDNEDDQLSEKDFQQRKAAKMEKIRKAMAVIKISQHDRTPQGYFTDSFRDNVLTVFNSYFAFKKCTLQTRNDFKIQIAKECSEHDTFSIFCNLIKSILLKGYRNTEGKPVAALYRPLHKMIFHIQNMTDAHLPVCKEVLEHTDYVKTLINKVLDWSGPHLNKEIKENDNILLRGMMGTLHNIGQDEENVPKLRKLNIIEAVKPYLESHSEMLRLVSLATLADVLNEEESEILKSNSKAITFIVKCLKGAMKNKMRRSNGWSVREIARTIHMIAINDNNKRMVFTHGAIPLLIQLADEYKFVQEQREAVGALWTLSFDKQNQEEIINDTDCKVIDTFVKHSKADDEVVKKICSKALWTMRNSLKDSQHYKAIGEQFCLPQTPRKDANDTHVMLSYNWGHQPIIKQICSNLRNNGIKVWMDVDDMQESTLQAMAGAVEKADIVLVCYSQKYKNSDNCRAEAEYAFQLKKRIIPLKMESGYKADGWLGFIIGARLFFDFGGKYPFENKIKDLIKEVQVQLNKLKGHTTEVANAEVKVQMAPVAQSKPPPPVTQAAKEAQNLENVKKWTPEHVAKWLDKNQLSSNILGRLSGIEVAFLHILVQESPNMYYKTIGEQLGVKDILTMAKLRFALEVFDVDI